MVLFFFSLEYGIYLPSGSACTVGDPSSIPGLWRSLGEGNGYPLQYSCLENSMDRGAWWVRLDWVNNSFLHFSFIQGICYKFAGTCCDNTNLELDLSWNPSPPLIHSLSVFNNSESPPLSFAVVQLLSLVWLFETPWTAACQASLSFTISLSLLKLMSIESMMPSNRLILCYPLLLLPSIFPSTGSSPMSQLFALGGQSIGTYVLFLLLYY